MSYQPGRPLWLFIFLAFAGLLLPSSLWAQANFLYTNDDQFAGTVSAFSVHADGTLTPIAGSPFGTGGIGSSDGLFANTIGIVGTFLFASNDFSRDISVFTINATTGALTPVPGSPFEVGRYVGLPTCDLRCPNTGWPLPHGWQLPVQQHYRFRNRL
jgi:hypothetical protein